MTRRWVLRTWPAFVPLGLALSCAAPQPARAPVTTEAPAAAPLTLPRGEWTGIGRYCLLENASAVATRPAELQGRSGLYPTSLKIERTTLAGEPVWCIDILSLNALSAARDRTQILLYLDPEPSVVAGAPFQLYRVRQAGFSLEEGAEMQFQTGGAGIFVTLTRDAGDAVLRIQWGYYVDCLRFRGDRVMKDGVYHDGREPRIYWSETLARQR